jgi:hypothetical protein
VGLFYEKDSPFSKEAFVSARTAKPAKWSFLVGTNCKTAFLSATHLWDVMDVLLEV